MDEQNDDEQPEQRSKDARHQPELTPSQNEQPVPARAAGGRQTRFLRTESVCSHMALRGVSRYSDTAIPLLFRAQTSKKPWSEDPGPTSDLRRSEVELQFRAANVVVLISEVRSIEPFLW